MNETLLNRTSVNPVNFGKVGALPVDGLVYAQPLVLTGVQTPSGGTRDLVFVATENDSVFAFDINTLSTTPVWQRTFLGDALSPCPSAPCTTPTVLDVGAPNVTPQVGITATPVIDATHGVIYVTAMTKENGAFYWRMHALNVATGAEMAGSPVLIDAAYPGKGNGVSADGLIHFDAVRQLSRAGLVLSNGTVFVAFTSFNNQEPTHGWLYAYNATSLANVGVWMTTPNSGDGTIWQSGGAPAVDSTGSLYFATGNGDPAYNSGPADLADSIMRVTLGAQGLSLADYFTPYNRLALATGDVDVGSGGVLVLPDQPGPYPHLLVGGGKQGTIYLLNRDNLGQFNAAAGATSDSQIVQELVGDLPGGKNYGAGLYGTPSYYQGKIFMAAAGDYLRSIPLQNGQLNWSGMSRANARVVIRGATASISANGTQDGIVWYLDASAYTYSWVSGAYPPTLTNGPAVLYAYSTDNLSTPLYSSNMVSADAAGFAVKFAVPTIADGKVFVGPIPSSRFTACALFTDYSKAEASAAMKQFVVTFWHTASDAFSASPWLSWTLPVPKWPPSPTASAT